MKHNNRWQDGGPTLALTLLVLAAFIVVAVVLAIAERGL